MGKPHRQLVNVKEWVILDSEQQKQAAVDQLKEERDEFWDKIEQTAGDKTDKERKKWLEL